MPFSKIVDAFSPVSGIEAIVLGGSRSRDAAKPDSDYDIALYYNAGELDTASLARAVTALDDGRRDGLLNPPGQWGPWINGGAWLTVGGQPVDILLRDIGRVRGIIRDCVEGIITIDYQCGHPFGFVNTIYAAETHFCKPIWQAEGKPVDSLKSLLYAYGGYSPKMMETIIAKFMWEAEFSLACGRKAALGGDAHYALGSIFRSVGSWVQVVYAVNETYLMNEKRSLSNIGRLPNLPCDIEEEAGRIYRLLSSGAAEEGYAMVDRLHSRMKSWVSEQTGQLPGTSMQFA